jgi:hypothetical protein
MIVNVSEAALHLGFKSRTPLQRLLRDGLIDEYRAGQRGRAVLLNTAPKGLPSLKDRVQALTQYREGSPLWDTTPSDGTPDWDRIAEVANGMLAAEHWGPPPWTALRWNTLQVVLEMAEEVAAGD